MNMQTYDLSVITVCKNAIHGIQTTIESVKLAKNTLNIEHVVIDGLSTDGTKKILDELSSSKSIDVLISEKDNGIYDAMNKGIKISSGKIIYFLNSGDKLYDTKTFELAINAFNQNNSIDFIYFDHIGINSDGSTGYSKKPTKLSAEYFNKTNICHQAIFYRKDCFDRIGFFDTTYRFLADFDWNLRAFFQHDIKAAYIPYPACFFDNCGVHTHDKFREIVQEERSRALRCNTAGKEHASFNATTLPTTSTSLGVPPQDTIRANKRVMFVAYGPNQLNGPNVWLQRLLPNIAKRNFTPEVIFLLNKNTNCEVINNLQENNITCHALLLSPYTEQNIINILQVIKDRSPDFFVPNLSVPAYFAAKWVKSAGIPTVGVIHSDDTFHHEIMDTFISGDSGYALSGAVCVSKFLHSVAQQNNGHGIPLLTSACGVPRGKKLASTPGKELRFIYTGRLIQRQKRIFDVIAACDVASQKIGGTYYSFYGEDREKGQAIASIQTCHNPGFLKYGGKLQPREIYPILAEHHGFILLSDYEGMSISLMESMACGLVPICLRTKSGSIEIIRHNENGLLVDNRGDDFLKAVYRLKNEKGLWDKLSKGARETVEMGYSIDICADRWADFLHSLADKTGDKTQIHIPALHEINLPPVKQTKNGMCREDKRMPRVHPVATPRTKQHDNFLNPLLTPEFADLFIVRTAIRKALDKHLPLFDGTLLDIGCGQMPYREHILVNNPRITRYIGLDFAQGKYADLRQPDLTWDGQSIPLADASVDCAIATEVLEHCFSPAIVLREIKRVLKPGGAFFFTTPFLWPIHDAPHDHYRYTPYALERLLAEAGFENVRIESMGGWNAALAQMIGLWLKRAPMSDATRKQAAADLFPFYEQLITTDVLPSDFTKNPMITGLAGTARVTHRTDKSGSPKIIIFTDQFPVISQTFILDQITGLMDRGAPIEHWSAKKTNDSVIHDNVRKYNLLHTTHYITFPPTQLKAKPELWLETFVKTNNISTLEGISTVHVHFGPNYYKLEPIFNKFPHIRVVVSFHGYDASKTFKDHGPNYYTSLFKRANTITTPSHYMKETLIQHGCPAHKVVIHRYGVDTNAFAPPVEPKHTSRIHMLSVARLVEKKGLEYAIRGFAKIHHGLDVEYRIVGEGPLDTTLLTLVNTLGITDKVRFLGKQSRDDVCREMAAADIFILTSITATNGDQEGVPVSLIEAQACGLPVVSSLHAGIPELVEHGHTGFLAEEKNATEIGGYMLALIKNHAIRAKFAANARTKVLQEFNIQSLNDALASRLCRPMSPPSKAAVEEIHNPVICPVCQGQFAHFEPFGTTKRPNALCPQCKSLERHRLLWLFLQQKTDFFLRPRKLLEVAPSKGFSEIIQNLPNIDYLSIDLQSPLAMRHMDLTALKLQDNLFDCILCYHVLEHVPNDRRAMSELYRVLKPGGWAIIQVPLCKTFPVTLEDPNITSPEERTRMYGQADYLRYYGLDFKKRLEDAGFHVQVNNFATHLPAVIIKRFALNTDEDIYYCTKK